MLTDKAIAAAAKRIGCDTASVRAVAEVESRGGGFLPSGNIKVLFEGHWFHRYTDGKFAATHPTLSYPKWTREHYCKSSEDEYKLRFLAALKLDRRAALMSTSYGLFQVMGFNFAVCGWKSVEDFYRSMLTGEDAHLDAFDDYVVNSGLGDELRRLDWDGFAHGYNGPEYRKNDYAGKLSRAYAKFSAGVPRG